MGAHTHTCTCGRQAKRRGHASDAEQREVTGSHDIADLRFQSQSRVLLVSRAVLADISSVQKIAAVEL